jgi:hypothetical protein
VYGNWSASKPEPCSTVPYNANRIQPSVPTQTETAWTHPDFKPPLKTFFTVDTGFDLSGIGSATIAPGGMDIYTGSAIPGWNNAALVLSLIRGTLYRVPLGADGRATNAQPSELITTTNRYRDIALAPDGRRLYIVTDVSGPYRNAGGGAPQTLANPGSVLEFTYIAD